MARGGAGAGLPPPGRPFRPDDSETAYYINPNSALHRLVGQPSGGTRREPLRGGEQQRGKNIWRSVMGKHNRLFVMAEVNKLLLICREELWQVYLLPPRLAICLYCRRNLVCVAYKSGVCFVWRAWRRGTRVTAEMNCASEQKKKHLVFALHCTIGAPREHV